MTDTDAWRSVSLGQVCEFKYGKSLPSKNRVPGPFDVYGSNGQVGSHSSAITNGPTIVIGRKGSVGEVIYSPVACWPIDTTYFIDSSITDVNLRWLAYRLSGLGLASLNKAAAVPGLSRDDAYRQKLILPPLEEQRRIADVLERMDALRAKRREAIARLDELAQSIFLDMFGAASNWPSRSLGELVAEFRYGTSRKSGSDGVPVLRIPNVVGGSIETSNLKFAELPQNELDRLRLRNGDLLFVRTNGNPAYVGRCAEFSAREIGGTAYADQDFAYASYLIRARPDQDLLDPVFARVFMSSNTGRRLLRERAKTSAGQFNINIEGLGGIPVPLAPIEMQREFAAKVASVATFRSRYERSDEQLDELFASLQQRAFRGDL